MRRKKYIASSIISAAVILTLTGCTSGADEATPSPEQTSAAPIETDGPPIEPENPLQADAEKTFALLPEADWRITHTAEGSSAFLDDVFRADLMQSWVVKLEESGWLKEHEEDSEELYRASLQKDGDNIMIIVTSNPENSEQVVTSAFYYKTPAPVHSE